MKKNGLLFIAALLLAGCSSIPSITYPPAPAPVAVPAIPPQVLAIITMICSSPAATVDPKVAAGCMVLPLFTQPAAK